MTVSHTYKILVLILISVCIQSCNLFSEKPSQDVFFGGEIVNALDPKIIIFYQSNPIDTIKLDRDNRFFSYIRNVKPGLYSFKNGAESQNMFLEPGDSTVIYLNAKKFDETLNFSGIGSEKNNFLIENYLLNEKNNAFVLSNADKEPKAFEKLSDSIRKKRQNKLRSLKEKYDFSDKFMDLAEKSIDFEYYDMKERYTYLVTKYQKEYISKIPADFYDYRENIEFNDPSLHSFYGYLKLVDNFLTNKVIEDCYRSKLSNCDETNNYQNIRRKLVLIDSLAHDEQLKNTYFSRLGAQAIFSTTTMGQLDSILALLKQENLPEKKFRNLQIFAAIQNVYMPGKNLPGVDLVNFKKERIKMTEIVKRPTVFYNWSIHDSQHYMETLGIINTLREKYPQIDFIGLNIDSEEVSPWLETMKSNGFIPSKEYQLTAIPIDKNFLKYFLNKLLFVDSTGKVIMGDVQLTTPQIEARIEKFLNPEKKDFVSLKG
ncbi:MAG TPA: hypothetical protein VFM70_05585 [Salinimicrobium sp.]|nr:hypothetical protein [Salinimicrobium sp.]